MLMRYASYDQFPRCVLNVTDGLVAPRSTGAPARGSPPGRVGMRSVPRAPPPSRRCSSRRPIVPPPLVRTGRPSAVITTRHRVPPVTALPAAPGDAAGAPVPQHRSASPATPTAAFCRRRHRAAMALRPAAGRRPAAPALVAAPTRRRPAPRSRPHPRRAAPRPSRGRGRPGGAGRPGGVPRAAAGQRDEQDRGALPLGRHRAERLRLLRPDQLGLQEARCVPAPHQPGDVPGGHAGGQGRPATGRPGVLLPAGQPRRHLHRRREGRPREQPEEPGEDLRPVPHAVHLGPRPYV